MSNEESNSPRPLRVLVIGAGMYTCGRGTDGYGTVLPAVFQCAKAEQLIDSLTVCATSKQSVDVVQHKAEGLGQRLNFRLPLDLWPREGTDRDAYQSVVRSANQSGSPFDCAVVAVPDHLHYEFARFLLENGIHTLLVKPFVTRIQHGRHLIELADQRRLLGMVEFHKRWDQTNCIMRDSLRSGRVGQPLYFHVEYSQRKCIPEEVFSQWVRDTNIFQYLGVHYADMVYFLTGAFPRRVLATGQKSWLLSQGIDTYDSIQTMIEWEGDDTRFVSTHLTNWIDPNCTSAMSDQTIKVIGTRGRIVCDQKNRGVQVVTDRGGIEDVNPYFSQFYGDADRDCDFDGYGYRSFLSFFRSVRDIIGGGKDAACLSFDLPTFRSALVSTAIVEANNASLQQESAWVDVDPGLRELVGSS